MIDRQVTVYIPTSPIRKHPDASMIMKTISMVREQLPLAKILITCDGVRPEQEYLRQKYEQYENYLSLWATNEPNVEVVMHEEFLHQTGMIHHALKLIKTPLILYIEHDFPVKGDIPWDDIAAILMNREVDLVRFYWESELVPQHKHMFLDKTPIMIGKVPVIRNGQWSQRPHIARTDFYQRVVDENIKETARTFIEDNVHGVFGGGVAEGRFKFWGGNRLCIYHPEGNISRCDHLDGREDEPKYEMRNE